MKFTACLATAFSLTACGAQPPFEEPPRVRPEMIKFEWPAFEPYVPPPPCKEGMSLVIGDYCPDIVQQCEEWLPPKDYDVCLKFRKASACRSKPEEVRHMTFCIDTHEYSDDPVTRLPKVMVTYNQMDAICAAQGKRMCDDQEWTKACEGPENLPYPYGYVRDSAICYQDGPILPYNLQKIMDGDAAEFAKFDIRKPVDAFPKCVSAYGVVSMPGSVDEWVKNVSSLLKASRKPYPFISYLKGGHPSGNTRARCRPATPDHDNVGWRDHLIGGRCCDAPVRTVFAVPEMR